MRDADGMQGGSDLSPIRVARSGPIATVVLDNPPVNAMGNDLLEALGRELRGLGEDPSIRVVVIAGAGERAFAAGASLEEFAEMIGSSEAISAHTALARAAFDAIGQIPQPVIAAVQATAVGGGFELALACDLVVADESARFGLPETGLGLIPGAGGTQRLPRRLGLPRATALVLLGSRITAHEAERLGLVHEVSQPGECLARAGDLAATLAERPRLALAAAKRLLRDAADRPLDEGLDRERDAFVALLSSEDARTGVEAFLAGTTPEFRHR
jgi:enoyl-CoA hydratase/carnithine racemase